MTHPIRLIPMKVGKSRKMIYYASDDKQYYQGEITPKTDYDLALFISFLTSAIIGTVLWLGKFFFPIPKITVSNPILWWFGFVVTTILPAFFWWMAYQAAKKRVDNHLNLQPFQPNDQQKRYLKNKWSFERAWILFVLLLLPPTTLLFFVLYLVKMNLIDAVLLTLHGTLFLRRLQPGLLERLKLASHYLT
ncbi:hypothetical protein [Fructobacillus fructosus]|uniref:hypothetical protein n=1 Tax=Fructobacillus fructosus TaxID=1631 RepID=UPI002DAECF1F|nr:hypothetical protein LMG30235_GOPAMIKF_00473 [Fructobacillus fructosus]CAK1231877.1 hypothetical protein LMG30234_GAICNKDF_00470 [Fructobacillus fructosus]CAK1232890.1 hypothetical protein R54866_LGPIEIPA_00517 [Fructobacillus fructosus]